MRAFITLLLVAVATAELAPLLKNTEPIPGKYILKIKDDFDMDAVLSTVSVAGGRLGHIYNQVFKGFAAELTGDLLDLVRRLPAVEYVEEDGVYRAQSSTRASWGIDRIDQRGLPCDFDYKPRGNGGSGYTVYVIDTGIAHSHPNFGGRATNLYDFDPENRGEDLNGHGTHCAGIVGAEYYGVATAVKLKSVRVLDASGAGSTSNICAGLEAVRTDATSNKIASVTFSGFGSTAIDDAVRSLVASGVPVAVAAGNNDADCSLNYSPARVREAIVVGATDYTDSRTDFSNYGSSLDLFAPGQSIDSIGNTGDAPVRESGTSMAAAHVAGALALFQGQEANMLEAATRNKIRNVGRMSPDEFLYVGPDE